MAKPNERKSVFGNREFFEARLEESDCPLWPHQIDALKAFVRECDKQDGDPSSKSPIGIVLPTGAGKTAIAVCAPYLANARKCLVVSPSKIVTSQLREAFLGSEDDSGTAFLVKFGFCQQDDFRKSLKPSFLKINQRKDIKKETFDAHDLIVSNVQRFPTEDEWGKFPISEVDLVIVDEAHHFPSDFWKRIVDLVTRNEKKVLFLTASPYRADGRGVLENGSAYHLTLQDAFRKSIIRRVEHVQIDEGDLTANAKDNDAKEDIRRKLLLGKVAELLKWKNQEFPLPADDGQHQHQHHALIMVKDTIEANRMKVIADASTTELELAVREYHGSIKSREENKEWFEKPEKGLKALIIVGMLREGYDFKPVSVVASQSKVHSPVKLYQFIGRGVRRFKDERADLVCHFVSHKESNQDPLFQTCIEERLVPEPGDSSNLGNGDDDKEYDGDDDKEYDGDDDKEYDALRKQCSNIAQRPLSFGPTLCQMGDDDKEYDGDDDKEYDGGDKAILKVFQQADLGRFVNIALRERMRLQDLIDFPQNVLMDLLGVTRAECYRLCILAKKTCQDSTLSTKFDTSSEKAPKKSKSLLSVSQEASPRVVKEELLVSTT